MVALYPLKAAPKLDSLDFSEVWSIPEKVLGSDLLKKDELVVAPGQTLEQWVARDPKTAYVLAVGFFRQPSGTSWRAVAPLPNAYGAACERAEQRSGLPLPDDVRVRFSLEDFAIDSVSTTPARRSELEHRGDTETSA
jgi:type VI secretion system protein VasD